MKRNLSIILFTLLSICVHAQSERDTSGYLPNVVLDTAIIYARKLDVPAFIKMVKTDTTFYKAFKSMRLENFNSINDFKVYDKRGKKLEASYYSETKQIYRAACRTMKVLEEKHTGNFFKKDGGYNYYTAELFASLFFTKGKVCNENDIVGNIGFKLKNSSGIETRKEQLKQLMFNPGSNVGGIPLMGKRAAIFTESMASSYTFTISEEDKNGASCYKFVADPLPQYKNKVVLNTLVTWFRKSDFSIVSRYYDMSYNQLGYNFHVKISVNLAQRGNKLLPTYISYSGRWHVVTQGTENVRFSAQFFY